MELDKFEKKIKELSKGEKKEFKAIFSTSPTLEQPKKRNWLRGVILLFILLIGISIVWSYLPDEEVAVAEESDKYEITKEEIETAKSFNIKQ